MKVRIRFFAMCKDLAGQENSSIDIPQNCDRQRLFSEIGILYPRLLEILPQVAIAINNVYVRDDGKLQLNDGDEISLIPPVSGG